jgi:hypothetical protein
VSDVIKAKVAECLDMAIKAHLKAATAQSGGDRGFWQKMEERWLHLAETYRGTQQFTESLLAYDPRKS